MHRSSLIMALGWAAAAILVSLFAPGWERILAVVPATFAAIYLFRAQVMGGLVIALAISLALSLAVGPAFAADAAADPTAVTAGSLFADVRGILEAVLGAAAAAIVGLVAWAANRWFGVTLDAQMREALQSAITNGVHLGLDEAQTLADQSPFAIRSAVLATAIGYVRRYVPDALGHFGLSEAEIEDLVRAQFAKLLPTLAAAV